MRRRQGLRGTPQEHAERAATAQATLDDAARDATRLARAGDCERAVKRLVDAARAQGAYVAHQAETHDLIAASSLELDRAIYAVGTCRQ